MKIVQHSLLLSALVLLASPVIAENVDPLNDGSQYAYAVNLGWLNGEPLGNSGPGMSLQIASASGWMWSANSGWISLNCNNTSSCDAVDYGIAHDGTGNLSGYAWSPNLGWISFSCEDSDSCGAVPYGVVVDLSTGEMTGYGYAANAGWISFSCENTASCDTVDYRIRLDLNSFGPLIFKDSFES